jgi:multicomponent Na+:H+ antiporter subunit F
MTIVTSICFGILSVSGSLCLARVVRRGSLADRIVALDSLLFVLVAAVAVLVARTRLPGFLDVLVVAALLGFVGTVTVARFIERRGA